VHPPSKNVAHQDERLRIPVRSGDTISITLLHSEDVRSLMVCEQSVGLISDAIKPPELFATIRGVWIIKDGHPIHIHMTHSKKSHSCILVCYKTETLL
jgi:hypothetical protein